MPNENGHNDVVREGEQDSTAPEETGGSFHRVPDEETPKRGENAAPGSQPGRGETGSDESSAAGDEPRHEAEGQGQAMPASPRPKQRRGFAAMDPAKQREIASKGGKASHALGTGHEWDSEAAREAGRKGGQASRGGRGKLPSSGGGTGGGEAGT